MKIFSCLLCLSFLFLAKCIGQIYIADSCRVSFFSPTSVEDIDAVNSISKPLMSITTGDIQMSIMNQDFIFKKALMQEHFNEDYMESDKYPATVFKGKINEKVDYTKNGVNRVTVIGTMDMHGVTNTITIPGTITITNGLIILMAAFDLKCADYKIKIPSVLGNNVAEQVSVKLYATMKPYQVKK